MHSTNDTKTPSYNSNESYLEWRRRLLQGVVPTHTWPQEAVEWVQIAYFPPSTPGASIVWGEFWYQAEFNGQHIYKSRDVGPSLYAPCPVVQEWLAADFTSMAERLGEAHAAQNMLHRMASYQRYPEYYSEHLLPFEAKLPEYITLARESEWLISGAEKDVEFSVDCVRAAQQYEIPYAVLRHLAWGDDENISRYLPSGHDIRALYIHPQTNRIYVQLISGRWYDGEEMLAQIRDARSMLTAEPQVDESNVQ